MVESGSVTYALPAPPGFWVAANECKVYRDVTATIGSKPLHRL